MSGLSAAEYLEECFEAAFGRLRGYDRAGARALLADVSRREAAGEISGRIAGHLREVLATYANSSEPERLLDEPWTDKRLEEVVKDPGARERHRRALEELDEATPPRPLEFVFYGTHSSSLPEIRRTGIAPQPIRYWGSGRGKAVLLAPTWRGALLASVFTSPEGSHEGEKSDSFVVVKVPAAGLPLEPAKAWKRDEWLMVRAQVPASGLRVKFGWLLLNPWITLDEAVALLEPGDKGA